MNEVDRMTIREVIERILADCPKLPHETEDRPNLTNFGDSHSDPADFDMPHTADTVKYGDPDRECTGVATSIAPTVDVIRRTGETGCNLLIVHEPTFWTHEDSKAWLEGDPLYREKTALMDRYGITVWRFHDHMHRHKPDLVFGGMTRQLGWEAYDITGERSRSPHIDKDHHLSALWQLPDMPFRDVVAHIKEHLGLDRVHYAGNPDAVIRRAAVTFHEYDKEPQQGYIQIMKDLDIDLLIPGESVNWATQYYIRDAGTLGMNRAILLIGHFNVESLGMKDLADRYIPALLKDQVRTVYVPAGNSYRYM